MTLAGIGRRAGVSTATVSKVLNGRRDVSPETRRRVQTVLDAYGYGSSASSAAGARQSLIDVLMIEMDDPWAAKVLAAIDRSAGRRGIDIVPSVLAEREVSDELITRLLARGSRGVLALFGDLSATQHRRLAARAMPCVSVGSGVRPPDPARSVQIDFRVGIEMATAHLLARGHRRIGLLLGPRKAEYSVQRLQGFRDAHRRTGIRVDESLIRWGRHDASAARGQVLALLDHERPPSAIVAGSDTMAIGAYQAADERGMSIGGDLAITGFDDRPEAQWLRPTLTTIRIPLDQLFETAVDMLLDPNPDGKNRATVPVELIIRDSTGGEEAVSKTVSDTASSATGVSSKY